MTDFVSVPVIWVANLFAGALLLAGTFLVVAWTARMWKNFVTFTDTPLPRLNRLRYGKGEFEFVQTELTEEILARIDRLEEALEYVEES